MKGETNHHDAQGVPLCIVERQIKMNVLSV
jgi:hypothetical protein